MWINRNEYDRLRDCELMKIKLEEEVSRLSELISSKVEDCKVGPWCKGCRHTGQDSSKLYAWDCLGESYVKEVAGEVQYCKKHLHEVCPEFERK